ncbi:MAG: hypothetical protein AB1757_00105 [Acidobacteriota bacterium]
MTKLSDIAAMLHSPVEKRLFAEYGAIFITRATPPPTIIFTDADAVDNFQITLDTRKATFGEYEIELQREACDALLAAAYEAAQTGLTISARAADAGRRSYADTVGLWLRNVGRGLEHWLKLEKLDANHVAAIQSLSPAEQVSVILELEDREQIYFGTFFDKSILYSVAAPGASQHLSMLAFDVMEYQDSEVERRLNAQGWFRTVVNDLPHFTYLGHAEKALPELGLHKVSRLYGESNFSFWIPAL